jgi:hypothetical protein
LDVRAGAGDLAFVLPASSDILELKSRTGRLSPDRRNFRAVYTAAGALWAMARTTDEAIELLRSWGVVPVGGRGKAA